MPFSGNPYIFLYIQYTNFCSVQFQSVADPGRYSTDPDPAIIKNGSGAARSRSFLLEPEPEPEPKKNHVYGSGSGSGSSSGSGNYPKETLP